MGECFCRVYQDRRTIYGNICVNYIKMGEAFLLKVYQSEKCYELGSGFKVVKIGKRYEGVSVSVLEWCKGCSC